MCPFFHGVLKSQVFNFFKSSVIIICFIKHQLKFVKFFCDCSRGIQHKILDSNSEIMLKFFFCSFLILKNKIVARINFSLSESSNLNPVPEHVHFWPAGLLFSFIEGLAASFPAMQPSCWHQFCISPALSLLIVTYMLL